MKIAIENGDEYKNANKSLGKEDNTDAALKQTPTGAIKEDTNPQKCSWQLTLITRNNRE